MQWMSSLSSWFDGMTPWFALTAGGFGLIAYAVGLKSVLGILEKVADIVAPILKFVVEAVIGGLRWSWQNIFSPGLKDIFDSWVTVVTCLAMGYGLWLYMDHKVDNVVDQLSFCQDEKMRLERLAKKQGISTQPGALDWLFKW